MYSKAKSSATSMIHRAKDHIETIAKGVKNNASSVADKVVTFSSFNKIFKNKFQLPDLQKELARETLQPGDILLVKTPTLFNSLSLRKATNMTYDHAFVVLDKYYNCLQITFPKAKLTKVWNLVHPIREPLIVRPKISEEVRDKFIEECYNIIGKKYDYSRLFKLVLKRKTGNSSQDRVLCSHAIFEAFCKANPEFLLNTADKDYLDLNRTGTFSIDDFHRMALLVPEKFDLISVLTPKRDELEDSSHMISEAEESASALEKYGIIYLTNSIIFLHQNSDLINILLTTIEVLHKFTTQTPSQKFEIYHSISSYIRLLKTVGEIQENGLSFRLKKRLMSDLLNVLILNPSSKRMIVLKNLSNWMINNYKINQIVGGIQHKAKRSAKYLGSKLHHLKAKI
ncbi:unnamed protein product [Moneuplotes crassus]|uniref:Uncharacterized protein n=2 Tax=Euplotes crassus TaxID=5936 RepID=A0AAD1UHX3_EUPCR|nr:unnamed protein product [Moneuplotes crassus]